MQLVEQIKDLMPDPDVESVRAFAARAKVPLPKLYNLLNGKDVDITTATLVRIAYALDCDVKLEPRSPK